MTNRTFAIAAIAALTMAAACSATPRDDVPGDANHGDAPRDGALPDSGSGSGIVDAGMDGGIVDAGPHGDPFAQLLQTPGHCTPDKWCYLFPAPHGNDYVKIVSSGPDDIWLTAWGIVMQWNGTVWRYHQPLALAGQPDSEFPMTIGESSGSNVWLVYGTALEHWDGAAWTILESLPLTGNPNYNAISVAPDDGTAFVTRSDGLMEVWHGSAESTISVGGFLGNVYAASSHDVFFIGSAGVLHYDGVGVTPSFTSPDGEFYSGFSGVTGDIFAAGQTLVADFDGSAWSILPSAPNADGLNFLIPVKYNGTTDVTWWNVFDQLGFLHWDGTTLSFAPVTQQQDGGLTVFNSGATIDGKLWLVGDDGAVYTSSDNTSVQSVQPLDWRSLTGMWAAAGSDAYFTVGPEVLHWDGKKLRATVLDLGDIFGDLGSIVGLQTGGVDELYVSGAEELPGDDDDLQGSVFVFDGTTWTKTILGIGPFFQEPQLFQIQPLGPGEAIGVGGAGLMMHYQHGAWTTIDTSGAVSGEDLVGLWAGDADHAWIVGANRDVYEWQRSTPGGGSDVLTLDTPGLDSDGNADPFGRITGAAGFPWIASPFTASVWIRDASGWTEMPANFSTGDQGGPIEATSPTNAYMANDGETFLSHFDGTSWHFEDQGTTFGDRFMATTPDGAAFLGNEGGIVFHP